MMSQSPQIIRDVAVARGAYFLASDSTLDLAIAFLNSFREHNPHLPLCLVPFNDESRRLVRLAPSYGFSVFSEAAILERCDRISRQFHGSILGHYRKLAIWEGPFDEFIYIDVDTVVLRSLDFVFGLLPGYGFLTSHSHMTSTEKWVWKRSIRRSSRLSPAAIVFAASTGFIASQKGTLTVELAESKTNAALELAPHMALSCKEQPFLNYLIVTSGLRYSSLYVIARSQGASNWERDIPLERWAGTRMARAASRQADVPSKTLIVHWAGLWQPTRMDKLRIILYRGLGLGAYADPPSVRRALRYGNLWRYYRYRREPSRFEARPEPEVSRSIRHHPNEGNRI
jgi:hypothetical protein